MNLSTDQKQRLEDAFKQFEETKTRRPFSELLKRRQV